MMICEYLVDGMNVDKVYGKEEIAAVVSVCLSSCVASKAEGAVEAVW